MATISSRWVLGHRVLPVETGADYGLLLITTPAGMQGPPPHYHEDAVELFLVIDGSMDVMCDGEWRTLGAGESFVVPCGSVHTFRNATDQETRWVTTFAPRGFERFFHDFGVPVEQDGAFEASLSRELIGRVIETCGDYGMILATGVDPQDADDQRPA